MDERINKPRVFLSHSQKNSEFIERLDVDLRKCQIDTWLFTVDIRHGKSWQDSIFESGIPTCDAVIVYLTEASIQSAVVKKEIDVALLQNLKDNNIAFLPYVDDAKFRTELRPDIQALQVPEWNDKNYQLLLPRVVAEIWRSFLEKTISTAIKHERLKRVEAELELEKYKSQIDDVFSKSENREFEFILDAFDRKVSFEFRRYIYPTSIQKRERKLLYDYKCYLHLFTYTALLSDYFGEHYRSDLASSLVDGVRELIDSDNQESLDDDQDLSGSYNDDRITGIPDFKDELLMHGLLDKFTFTTTDEYHSEQLHQRLEPSKKYFRFRYWLAYHKKLPERILVEVENSSGK